MTIFGMHKFKLCKNIFCDIPECQRCIPSRVSCQWWPWQYAIPGGEKGILIWPECGGYWKKPKDVVCKPAKLIFHLCVLTLLHN